MSKSKEETYNFGEDEGKRRFFKDLQEMGLTISESHIVFDLMQQGKEEMLNAIRTVANRAPDHLCNLVYISVLNSLFDNADEGKEITKRATEAAILYAVLGSRLQRGELQ